MPNIIFAVKQSSKYNTDLRKNHFWDVKKVIQYLKNIIQMRLMFGQIIINLLLYSLTGYINNNFAKILQIKSWE